MMKMHESNVKRLNKKSLHTIIAFLSNPFMSSDDSSMGEVNSGAMGSLAYPV